MVAGRDNELDALRAQRMKELQEQLHQQAARQLKAEEQAQEQAVQSANIDAVLRRHLAPDARARLARIALVEPERAQTIRANLASMYAQGELTSPLTDASLKKMLATQSKSRSNASVRRI